MMGTLGGTLRIGARSFLFGAVLAGCSSPSATSPAGADAVPSVACNEVQSGKRLKAMVYLGEDGSQQLADPFYDSEIAYPCNFETAGDGRLRCLPVNFSLDVQFGYRDSECTRQILSCTNCGSGDAPEYAADIYASSGLIVFPVTRTEDVPSTTFRKLPDGSCVPGDQANSAVYYDVGPELPSTTFVAATEEKLGSRIKKNTFVGEDGSRHPSSGLFDSTTEGYCVIGSAADGSMRCLPDTVSWVDGGPYRDTGCTSPVLIEPQSASEKDAVHVKYAIRREAQGCHNTHVYALTPLGPLPQVYDKDPDSGQCTADTSWATPIDGANARGDEVPPSTFVRVSLNQPLACGPTTASGSRLLVRGDVLEDGAAISYLYDPQISASCRFDDAGDGQVRCYPPVTGTGDFYADAACTRKIAEVGFNPSECGSASHDTRYLARTEILDQGRRPHIYLAGAALGVPDTIYRLDPSNACISSPNRDGDTFFEVGSEVPLSTFVTATLQMQ